MNARIPLPDYDELGPSGRAVFDEMRNGRRGAVQGPIRAVIHNPDLADRWQRFGSAVRYETSLDPHISELIILTVAAFWNAPLEWALHVAHASSAGIPPEVAEQIWAEEDLAQADPLDAAVHRAVLEILRTGEPTDSVYDALVSAFGVTGVVEFVTIVGYYSMVAMTLKSHRIPAPDGLHLPPRPSWSGR